LSRPRRFGKSVTLTTLYELFVGNRDLFNGLYIEDKWDWDKKHPVIRISFGSGDFSTEEKFYDTINDDLVKSFFSNILILRQKTKTFLASNLAICYSNSVKSTR